MSASPSTICGASPAARESGPDAPMAAPYATATPRKARPICVDESAKAVWKKG